jgi:hypothetical protein
MTLTCLCGAVCVAFDIRLDFVNECNCVLCRKSGARWAYLEPDAARIDGDTRGFTRTDKPDAAADLRFCPTCGTTTHFTLTDEAAERFGTQILGVNVRLADEAELAGVELRFPDGAHYAGVGEIPYLRAPITIGA